jgi:hypothetical protein
MLDVHIATNVQNHTKKHEQPIFHTDADCHNLVTNVPPICHHN